MTTLEALARCVKRCPKCGETKPVDAFNRDRGSPDGRNCWCKACQAAAGRAYRAKNREAYWTYMREYMRRRAADAKEANERMDATVKALARLADDYRRERDEARTAAEHWRELAEKQLARAETLQATLATVLAEHPFPAEAE